MVGQLGEADVERWLAHLGTLGQSPRTVARRRWAIRSLLRHIDPAPLGAVTEDLVLDWLATMPRPSTRHAALSDLRVLCRWALRRGLLDHDPTEHVPRVLVPRTLPRPLPDGAPALVLAACRDVLDRRIVLLGLCAGLRASEMAALHRRDIDQQHLIVRAGKGGVDRRVPTHPALWAELVDVRGWVLPSPRWDCDHLSPITVSSRMTRLLRSVGIEGSAHRLRHSFASELARATGGDVLLIGDLLGHQDPSTTLSYCRPDADRAAVAVSGLWR
jgi:integrase